MKNRIKKHKKNKENLDDLRTFFLACEFKPGSDLWSVLDPFAYDIKPAFIHGSLGILSYDPMTYAVIDIEEHSTPLLGYIMTITHPETILLLDKIKGVYGKESFNMHSKRLVHAFTDVNEVHNAWCYVLNEYVLEMYEQLQMIELGIHDQDEELIELLEKIEEYL
jgi:hypothetical protein